MMWIVRSFAVFCLALAALLYSRDERSELTCERTTGTCVLIRVSTFSRSSQSFPLQTLQTAEVVSYGKRRAPSTIILVTSTERIPFSSRYGYPYSRSLAGEVEHFVQDARRPTLTLTYDSTRELLPHIAVWSLIGLSCLIASFVAKLNVPGRVVVRRRRH